MTANDILDELKPLGYESYKKTMMRHGAKEPCFGVKIEDMKKIQKRVKKDYQLALDLFDTGVSDAMYLAGLIADDEKMTKKDLQKWIEAAYFPMVSEYTVPWVAAEGKHGWELGLKWIESKKENITAAGWCTLSGCVALTDDEELDLKKLGELLERVPKLMANAPNRVKYAMNGFVIAVGCYVAPLTKAAIDIGKKLGTVVVDMGDTSCKVPSIVEYIKKAKDRGSIGKKRKTVKC